MSLTFPVNNRDSNNAKFKSLTLRKIETIWRFNGQNQNKQGFLKCKKEITSHFVAFGVFEGKSKSRNALKKTRRVQQMNQIKSSKEIKESMFLKYPLWATPSIEEMISN